MDILAINLLSGLLSVKNITREVQLELACAENLVNIFTITIRDSGVLRKAYCFYLAS